MPTPFASSLIGWTSGQVSEQEFTEAIYLKDPASVTGGLVSSISAYKPWESEEVADLLKYHPLAVMTSLSFKITPGSGVFGRAVELHTAWGNDSEPAPTTAKQMSKMFRYKMHTYGGAGDPGDDDENLVAVFNEARSDVLKARNFPMGGRTVLYYYFTDAKFGTVQVDGNRFVFKVENKFTLYGRN